VLLLEMVVMEKRVSSFIQRERERGDSV
jgi:hypothetical protein